MITRALVIVRMHQTNKVISMPCHRHCDAYEILHNLDFHYYDYDRLFEGFLTNTDRILNRDEAADYALEHHQITQEAYDNLQNGLLYSEDLW